MINLFLLLLFLTCLGITAAWIAENPGQVTIYWFDYRIDTSFAFLLFLALLAAITLAYAYVLIRRLWLAPYRLSHRRSLTSYRKGLTELTYSVAALAAADIDGAEAHTRKAEKLLGATPLTLLLSAQIARNRGDEAKTRLLLEQMLEHEETEYLAARSLSDVASKQHLFPKALALAQRAQAINPKNIAHLVSLHIRLSQWQEALVAIDKAARQGRLARKDTRRYRGLLHLQQGKQWLENGAPHAALAAARRALRELPEFTPTVVFAAKAFTANDQPHKAIKLIFKAWKRSAHPQLAEAFRVAISKEPREKQQKLIQKLNAIHTETSSDSMSWVCGNCGQGTAQWDAHCPTCGAFDTLEWKKRELKFAE